ncbi:MAG: tetratricopeptide repeat protein [Betaproteobacteria bacterium]|nr:tetratricopeptide repeat protein [Betaproteobacteria bacterium]
MPKGRPPRIPQRITPQPQRFSAIQGKFQQAVAFHQRGDLDQAERLYREVVSQAPAHFDALHLLGVVQYLQGRHEAALELIGRALKLNRSSAAAHLNMGNALLALQRLEEALASYDRALALKHDYADALNNRGAVLLDLKRPEDALKSFERALQLKPDYANALTNRGNALLALKRPPEALASLDQALAIWPLDSAALNSRGNALLDLGRPQEALESFERALQLKPDYAKAFNNRGNALLALRRTEDALESFERALQFSPGDHEVLGNRGNALLALKRFEDAADCFARLVEIAPDKDYALGKLHHSRLSCCDWVEHASSAGRIVERVEAGRRANFPFSFLAVSASAPAQSQCARVLVADEHPASPMPLWTGQRYEHDRIRVAYISADFREHPVSYLMAGLWERHDHGRFETIAISLKPEEFSLMRHRVKEAFGRFIDVSVKSDRETAALLRELEVDIAVDLMGFTGDCRPAIFAHRPAPIQVNYLGYPGTMGADYIDYILADRFVIPEDKREHYAEKVVYLPDSFQANDDKRRISERVPSRAEAGLPESGLVFCSFNNSYKINPPVFDVWMRLLKAVPGSVLWLVTDQDVVQNNLRREARNRGVEARRLIFAPRLPYADHLARFQLADLFLDTLPFNAGTTASDALWAGVPVLTCTGEAFAARMAGSLLHAIGLPELVTHSMEEYEALALTLAHPSTSLRYARDERWAGSLPPLSELRARLARNRTTYPLFDTDRFRRHIEAAYIAMWERVQRGEPPESFAVQAIA